MLPIYKYSVSGFADLIRSTPNIRVTKYENFVSDFDGWVELFFDALELGRAQVGRAKDVLHLHFKASTSEDIDAHKRQMLPGDHVRKLKPETIKTIDEVMSKELRFFGYVSAEGKLVREVQ